MRSSLQFLHSSLSYFSDVIVVVENEGISKEFPCVSVVLASASRPLAAMLYGALREVTPSTAASKPRLVLRGTEPWCFESLLRFVHGEHVALTVDSALRLYHAADYYEVLSLRDGCCSFLLDAVQASNCCQLLARSLEVNCEPLEERCVDFLTCMNLASVATADPHYASLPPEVLHRILSCDNLVCENEIDTLRALVRWYGMRPDSERSLDWLLRLLRDIRWHLIPSKEHATALELVCRLAEPGTVAPDEALLRSLWRHYWDNDDCRDKEDVSCAPQEQAVPLRASALLPLASAMLRTPPEEPIPNRVLWWGCLAVHWPAMQTGASAGSGAGAEAGCVDDFGLACTHEYTVGRSRKCNIRVGHNASQPYISSQHFRVFYQVKWPASSSSDGPRLQPWLEDLSQNGTFINGEPMGRGVRRLLHDDSRIDLVFPQGRQGRTHDAHHHPKFPYFIFSSANLHLKRETPAMTPAPVPPLVCSVTPDETGDDEAHSTLHMHHWG